MTKTDELERQKKARLDIAPDQPKLASRIDQMQAVDPEPLRETVGDLRPARGRADLKRPNFSAPVSDNGYALWYIEGSSLCGRYQIAVIGRVGSALSHKSIWKGARRLADEVSIQVRIDGPGGRRYAQSPRKALSQRTASRLEVGTSMMRWDNGDLIIDIDMIRPSLTSRRIAGQITLSPSAVTQWELALSPHHIWRPFAPHCQIAVDLDQPLESWRGHGYFDAYFGGCALDDDFDSWRCDTERTSTSVTIGHAAIALDGGTHHSTYRFDAGGKAQAVAPESAPALTARLAKGVRLDQRWRLLYAASARSRAHWRLK